MLSAKEVRNIVCENKNSALSLESLIVAAQKNHINYVFIDKNPENVDLMQVLRDNGYSVIVGYGDAARIKISW